MTLKKYSKTNALTAIVNKLLLCLFYVESHVINFLKITRFFMLFQHKKRESKKTLRKVIYRYVLVLVYIVFCFVLLSLVELGYIHISYIFF